MFGVKLANLYIEYLYILSKRMACLQKYSKSGFYKYILVY